MKVLLITTLTLIVACSASNSPEGTLNEFISLRFSGGIKKDNISSYIGGELQEEINSMTEEEFSNYLQVEGLSKRKVTITHKNCESTKCFLTYILSYNTSEDNKRIFQTDTKKIAEVIKTESGWRIAKITHLKTFHEAKEEMKP